MSRTHWLIRVSGELERDIEEESGHLVIDDDLQRHLPLRDRATRLRFQIKTALGLTLITLKKE